MKISSLTLIVTDDCNFNCIYCYKRKSKNYMKYRTVENALIFFPSWLQHEVQINNSNDDRVILSFNINWRDENADN